MKISIDKDIKKPKQYSKIWMTRWQMFIMFWLSIFFISDIYFNKGEHLETLLTSIIATVIPYFCKSYFETKQQKISDMQEAQLNISSNDTDC